MVPGRTTVCKIDSLHILIEKKDINQVITKINVKLI
jgi:hypothetical protein